MKRWRKLTEEGALQEEMGFAPGQWLERAMGKATRARVYGGVCYEALDAIQFASARVLVSMLSQHPKDQCL